MIDTTPDETGGGDIVLNANEAATLIRPGRPTVLCMPDGVNPVAEVAEQHVDRAANLQSRIAHARANRQEHADPYNRKLNSALVSALMTGVVYGRRHYGFDTDFDIDEINGLFETAKSMCQVVGNDRNTVFEEMIVLVGSMREMKTRSPLESDGDEEPNGELVDDLDEF